MGETKSFPDERAEGAAGLGTARLVLALECARPLAPPLWVDLAGVAELEIGRGTERRLVASDGARPRLEVPDARMSVSHARLARDGDGWVVEDMGSKNGTLLNGLRATRAAVKGDDLIEAGAAFFVLQLAPEARSRSELQAPRGLRTLCPPLASELRTLARVARADVPILLEGETGTGKEVVARAIHDTSGRGGPFVAVNCGALPEPLVESELFGARRGAFSGAVADRDGLIRAADRGTLFLDEIAELPEPAQVTLLRVMQEGEVRPLGGTAAIKVDLRVVAATHEDLGARVAAGRFRIDLYARLKGYRFRLPPLRARRADMGLLVGDILARAAGDRAPRLRLERAVGRALFGYRWPLNIRELEQALRAACAIAEGDELELAMLPEEIRGAPAAPEPPATEERARFLDLVRTHGGNVSAIARALQTSRSQVRRLARRHGVDLGEERG